MKKKILLFFAIFFIFINYLKTVTIEEKCPSIRINSQLKFISYRINHQIDLLGCKVLIFYKKFPYNYGLMDFCESNKENMLKCIELSKIKDIEVLSNFPDILKSYLKGNITKETLNNLKEIAKIFKEKLSIKDYDNFRYFFKISLSYDNYYKNCENLNKKINYAIKAYQLLGNNLVSELKHYSEIIYFLPFPMIYEIWNIKGYGAETKIRRLNYYYIESMRKIYGLLKLKYTKEESLIIISGICRGTAFAIKNMKFDSFYKLVNFLINNDSFKTIIKNNRCSTKNLLLYLFLEEKNTLNLIKWFEYGKLKKILNKLDDEIKYSNNPSEMAWYIYTILPELSNIYRKLNKKQKEIFETLILGNYGFGIFANSVFIKELYYQTDYFQTIIKYPDYHDKVFIEPGWDVNFILYKFEAVLVCNANDSSVYFDFFSKNNENKFTSKMKEKIKKNMKKKVNEFDVKWNRKFKKEFFEKSVIVIRFLDYGTDPVFFVFDIFSGGFSLPEHVIKKGALKAVIIILKNFGKNAVKTFIEKKIYKKIGKKVLEDIRDKVILDELYSIFNSFFYKNNNEENRKFLCEGGEKNEKK